MAEETRGYTFLDPEPLARSVVEWLYVHAAAGVLYGLATAYAAMELSALPAGAPRPAALQSDLSLSLTALALVGSQIVVGFLILKWTYRTSRNVHAVARGLSITPPWAVGWYFVPVFFLWKPFQALRETWQASTRPQAWREVPTPVRMRWWWGLFIASSVLAQIAFRLGLKEEYLLASNAVDALSTFVTVPLDLVFIGVVRELTRRQVVELTFGDAEPR